jgi:hypothetical protein
MSTLVGGSDSEDQVGIEATYGTTQWVSSSARDEGSRLLGQGYQWHTIVKFQMKLFLQCCF